MQKQLKALRSEYELHNKKQKSIQESLNTHKSFCQVEFDWVNENILKEIEDKTSLVKKIG